MRTEKYSFEKDNDRRRLSPQAAGPDLELLLNRLEVARDRRDGLRPVLLPMVQRVHLNIRWYENAVRREQRWRRGYLAGSMALIVGIPGCVFCLSKHGVGAPAVAAILTGLLGLHKALSSALNQRKVVGNFWRAAAALKRRLYEFEDTWRGKAVSPEGPAPLFLDAVSDEIQAARAIRDEEQERFFDQFSYPVLDLAGILNTGGARAAAMVARHRDPRDRAAAGAAINRSRTEMAGLEALIGKRRQQLDETRDDDEARYLQTSLHALEQRRQVLELTLLKEEALLTEP